MSRSGHRGQKETRETLGRKAKLDRKALKAILALLARKALLVLMENQ